MALTNVIEAIQVWDWYEWRVLPDVWLECQSRIRDLNPPSPTDPELATLFLELRNPLTTRPRRLDLLEQLLRFIRTHRPP